MATHPCNSGTGVESRLSQGQPRLHNKTNSKGTALAQQAGCFLSTHKAWCGGDMPAIPALGTQIPGWWGNACHSVTGDTDVEVGESERSSR